MHQQPAETHNQSFCEKGLFALPGASAWGAGIGFGAHLGTYYMLSGNIRQQTPSLHSPSALLQLISVSQNEACTVIWNPGFYNHSPRDHLALVVSGVYTCSPIVLYIFAYFKTSCLKVWLPISLNLGSDWGPPLWTLTGLANPQLLGITKNKINCLNNHKDSSNNQELGQGWVIRFIFYTRPLLQDWQFHLM